jgi:hypothetical protein
VGNTDHEYGRFLPQREAPPFADLVALHITCPGNRLDGSFPINLLLEVGEHHLLVDVRPKLLRKLRRLGQKASTARQVQLRVRLRHCHVRYKSEAIAIDARNKYESKIHEGSFRLKQVERSHSSTTSQLDGKVAASAQLQHISAVGALAVGGHAAIASGKTSSTEKTASITPDIYVVRAAPFGWRIGDPVYGDPRNSLGLLYGKYFYPVSEETPHTCEAEFLRTSGDGTLVFTVTIRDGLYIERIDSDPASKDEKEAAISAMRDQIAALRLERDLKSGGKFPDTTADEMVIEAVTCEVMRANDDVAPAETDPVSLEPVSVFGGASLKGRPLRTVR